MFFLFRVEVCRAAWFIGLSVGMFESFLQAIRTETIVDGLLCAASFFRLWFSIGRTKLPNEFATKELSWNKVCFHGTEKFRKSKIS